MIPATLWYSDEIHSSQIAPDITTPELTPRLSFGFQVLERKIISQMLVEH
jgi:hypothetical protein